LGRVGQRAGRVLFVAHHAALRQGVGVGQHGGVEGVRRFQHKELERGGQGGRRLHHGGAGRELSDGAARVAGQAGLHDLLQGGGGDPETEGGAGLIVPGVVAQEVAGEALQLLPHLAPGGPLAERGLRFVNERALGGGGLCAVLELAPGDQAEARHPADDAGLVPLGHFGHGVPVDEAGQDPGGHFRLPLFAGDGARAQPGVHVLPVVTAQVQGVGFREGAGLRLELARGELLGQEVEGGRHGRTSERAGATSAGGSSWR
jgi:hypothetical protein